MTKDDDSVEEIPSSVVEIEVDYPNGWPGGSVVVHCRMNEKDSPLIGKMKVALIAQTGRAVAGASPQTDTTTLEIPPSCALGNYSLCVRIGPWNLDSVPFEVMDRQEAELLRKLLRACDRSAEALRAAEKAVVDTEVVMDLVCEVEALYLECGETELARLTWEEISERFRNRGLSGAANDAYSRALALQRTVPTLTVVTRPTPKSSNRFRLEGMRAPERSRPGTAFRAASDVKLLVQRYAFRLHSSLARQWQMKRKVEDLLRGVLSRLCNSESTECLLTGESYLARIARCLMSIAKRREGQENKTMKDKPRNRALGNLQQVSPEDLAVWSAYQEQFKRKLEQLAPEERKTVMLARYGHTYSELAAAMSVSAETLRNSVRRGYLRLIRTTPPEED
jgi:DNA-directed RNA polymerase specialized sigma24 family protein